MKKTVRISPCGGLDLVEQFEYFVLRENVTLAERFRAAFDRTCGRLCRNPESGPRYLARHRKLIGVRWAAITGFKNHLIFYRPSSTGINVIRVLHGARKITAVLEKEA